MEQEKRKSLKNLIVKYDPKDNTLLSSKLTDDYGNTNLFRLIIDSKESFLRQRIYTNAKNSF